MTLWFLATTIWSCHSSHRKLVRSSLTNFLFFPFLLNLTPSLSANPVGPIFKIHPASGHFLPRPPLPLPTGFELPASLVWSPGSALAALSVVPVRSRHSCSYHLRVKSQVLTVDNSGLPCLHGLLSVASLTRLRLFSPCLLCSSHCDTFAPIVLISHASASGPLH